MANADKRVSITVSVSEELLKGIRAIARMKGISIDSLLRGWVEEGLEREELRFERMLLFAGIAEDLDEGTAELLAKIAQKYFDEASDGNRGLDGYMVRSQNTNSLYRGFSGTYSYYPSNSVS